jgi:hypothetical protein
MGTKKASMQTTHVRVVSVVLLAKAVPNADMSLTWLFERQQNRYANNGRNKKPA